MAESSIKPDTYLQPLDLSVNSPFKAYYSEPLERISMRNKHKAFEEKGSKPPGSQKKGQDIVNQ